MVLLELGNNIVNALSKIQNARYVDTKVYETMLKEIGNALIASDVNVKLVVDLRTRIINTVRFDSLAPGINKYNVIRKAVFKELFNLISPNVPNVFTPKRRALCIIMFVGLQGSGKTTTLCKFANYYKKRNYLPGLVCADTFRAGAFDQLKQNATRIGVPFYGSTLEPDPVKVAINGVKIFREEAKDLILVDTSGRHSQDTELFKEMVDVKNAINPNLIILVLDSTTGQAAYDQALAFRKSVDINGVILTKTDGHAKGGGAFSAVAATKSPVLFIGTGEHLNDLALFDANAFVRRLMGSAPRVKDIKEVMPPVPQSLAQTMMEVMAGKRAYTFRMMKDSAHTLAGQGVDRMLLQLMPNVIQGLEPGQGDAEAKIMLTIVDSMTNEELDAEEPLKNEVSRKKRLARGSGRTSEEVDAVFEFKSQMMNVIELNKQMQHRGGGKKTVQKVQKVQKIRRR